LTLAGWLGAVLLCCGRARAVAFPHALARVDGPGAERG
jgi:hypothetical protein